MWYGIICHFLNDFRNKSWNLLAIFDHKWPKNVFIDGMTWKLRTVKHPFYLNIHSNRLLGSDHLFYSIKTPFLRVDNGPIRLSNFWTRRPLGHSDSRQVLLHEHFVLQGIYTLNQRVTHWGMIKQKINFVIIMKWTNDH